MATLPLLGRDRWLNWLLEQGWEKKGISSGLQIPLSWAGDPIPGTMKKISAMGPHVRPKNSLVPPAIREYEGRIGPKLSPLSCLHHVCILSES